MRAESSIARWLARPRRLVGVGVALVVVTYVLAQAGSFENFLQFTIIGLAIGAVYAISAAGLVLTYSTTGVFNFAHGAVGMVAAYLYWQFRVEWGWPTPVSMVVAVVVVGVVVGLGLELVMRSFRDAPASTSLTVTIALTVLLIGIVQTVFKPGVARGVPGFFGIEYRVEVFGVRLSWDEVMIMMLAILVALALRYLLFVSRTGVAMRAVVDNASLAGMNGTNPVTIARYSWVLGSLLGALAGVLIAPRQGAMQAALFAFVVVAAFGPAIVGRLYSLPLTFAGALGLGVFESWFAGIINVNPGVLGDNLLGVVPWQSVAVALPGLFLLAALLFLPQQRLRLGRVVGRDEPRVPGGRESLVAAVGFVFVVGVVAAVLPSDYLQDTARALVFGLLLLSLVLLTGFSGQISLAQYVFLGLGAWAMGTVGGGSSLAGLAAAAMITIPLGALIALPALRLQGLYLALSTFAIAVVSRSLIFQNEHIYGTTDVAVGRPKVLGVDFSGDRMFIVLCAVMFAVVGVAVLAVRRSSFGRRLAALRDSPVACATLGLDIRATKLIVFCGSASIAGLAGGMFGSLESSVGTISFEAINNVILFLFAIVGGVTTVSGALIGGALFSLLPLVSSEWPEWSGVPFAIVAITAVLLGRQPNGLAGLLSSAFAPLRAIRRPGPRDPAATPSPETGNGPARPPAAPGSESASGADTPHQDPPSTRGRQPRSQPLRVAQSEESEHAPR